MPRLGVRYAQTRNRVRFWTPCQDQGTWCAKLCAPALSFSSLDPGPANWAPAPQRPVPRPPRQDTRWASHRLSLCSTFARRVRLRTRGFSTGFLGTDAVSQSFANDASAQVCPVQGLASQSLVLSVVVVLSVASVESAVRSCSTGGGSFVAAADGTASTSRIGM